jgi:hypothetical protein
MTWVTLFYYIKYPKLWKSIRSALECLEYYISPGDQRDIIK